MFDLKFTDTVNKYNSIESFQEGLAIVNIVQDNEILEGFIDKRGKEVIPCQFSAAKNFSEGLAPVRNRNFKWGYIDINGNLVIPYQFDAAFVFNGGVAPVKLNGKKFYINKQGEKITNEEFEETDSFKNGYGIVTYFEEGQRVRSYINQDGILFGKYYWCSFFDSNGLAIVRPTYERKYYIINKEFKTIGNPEYSINVNGAIYAIKDGMVLVKKNNVCCFYDCKFEKITPELFYEARSFCEGVAIVEKDNNIGFVNKDGVTKFFSKYIQIKDFHEGLAAVKNTDYLWGFINKKGDEVIPCQFKSVDDFSEGLAVVKDKDNNMYYIDKKGNKKLEMPVIYCSTLEIEGLEFDNKKKNGPIVSIEAETEEELNIKKLQVLRVARELIVANNPTELQDIISQRIDEIAYSIPIPHKRELKKKG